MGCDKGSHPKIVTKEVTQKSCFWGTDPNLGTTYGLWIGEQRLRMHPFVINLIFFCGAGVYVDGRESQRLNVRILVKGVVRYCICSERKIQFTKT